MENNKQLAATITAALIKNDIDVYAVIPKETQNLEAAFIEITNGGGNQIA